MRTDGKWARLADWAWFVAFAGLSSVWCVTAARQLGPTFDEPLYLARGLECWRTGSHAGLMKLGTMPLPVDLATLPLYLWESWQGVRLDPEKDLDRLLPWARAGTLVFWWLLLVYGRLAGRSLAGPWGGRLAVALLACEPSLLAHAALATTDVAVSACLLALVYHFRTGRDAGWLRRVGWPAFWFAAAVLAKASGLVFGPLCLAVVELECRLRRPPAPDAPPLPAGLVRRLLAILLAPRFRRDVLQLTGLGLVIVFAYCGCDGRTEPSFVRWAEHLPAGTGRRVMTWLAGHLHIFSNAGEGLVRQVKHNMHGHGTYILGVSASRAVWYYFPVALAIKLSAALLALPALLLLLRPRELVNWACLAALVLLAFSMTCRVQIGVRLVLPLVVLAVVGLAAAAARACRAPSPAWVRCALAACVSGGAGWTAAAAILVWPHGLCYVNEFWGGTRAGYRCLSDSNYDWGQGLPELAAWQRAHGLAVLDVWYFGSDPVLQRLPLRSVQLHLPPTGVAADVPDRVAGKYLAASTTLVYGNSTATAEHRRAAAYLQSLEPVDRTTTFLIYDLSGEKAARRAARAGEATAPAGPLPTGSGLTGGGNDSRPSPGAR
jgi:hypothetical protein